MQTPPDAPEQKLQKYGEIMSAPRFKIIHASTSDTLDSTSAVDLIIVHHGLPLLCLPLSIGSDKLPPLALTRDTPMSGGPSDSSIM